MTTVRELWRQLGAVALESTWKTAPTSNLPRHLGGTYLTLPLTEMGVIGRRPQTFVDMITGSRALNTISAVPGNRIAEGDVNGVLMGGSWLVLSYCVLGGKAVVADADAGNPLGTSADISTGSISVTNPTTGAVMEFVITAATDSGSPTITVTGVDCSGATQVEILPVTLSGGAATVYTEYSYDTITSVVTSNFTAGACTVNGYVKWTHTVTMADASPSIAMWNNGDPGRASDSEGGQYVGMVVQEAGIEYDANAMESPVTYKATLQGVFPTHTTKPTIYVPKDRPFAGWMCTTTINSTAYARLLRGDISLMSNNTLFHSADGSPDPALKGTGQLDVSGNMDLLPNDDTEWNWAYNQTDLDVQLKFENTGDLLEPSPSASYTSIEFDFPDMAIGEPEVQDVSGAQALRVPFKGLYKVSDGPVTITIECRVPSI